LHTAARHEGQQACRPVGVVRASGFPVNHQALAVQLADGINVSDELVSVADRVAELDLQIAAGIPDLQAVILDKSRE
jgi:hypothetical protein